MVCFSHFVDGFETLFCIVCRVEVKPKSPFIGAVQKKSLKAHKGVENSKKDNH